MKIVDRATRPPAKCALTGDLKGPFIDTQVYVNGIEPYIYLHVPVVEYMARELLGMVGREEVEAELAELRNGLASYAAKVAQLTAFVEAHERAQELAESAKGGDPYG